MDYVADEILLERMSQKEEYLGSAFDAIEARASALLAFIAILAGLPAVIADKLPVYWGKSSLFGSLIFVAAMLFAVLAGGAVLWALSGADYEAEETEGLIDWRDKYVNSYGNSYTEAALAAEIRSELIKAIAQRIKRNEELNAEKSFRLQMAYYATTLSAIFNVVLLIPIAAHQF
jgi:hypothetical protein